MRDTDDDGDGWTISGSKMFITNGMWADVVLLFARTGGPGPRGVTAFLVPMDSPGLTRREIHGKLGLRGQPTAELTFDGVRVPDSARVGAEGTRLQDRDVRAGQGTYVGRRPAASASPRAA